jgi:metallo-beta-lactamase family protein
MGKKLRLHFYGGTRTVTGANFLLEDSETFILVDCGLTQGQRFKPDQDPNREPFPFNPHDIDFLFVTHSHIDHIGRIPKLVKEGFSGRIISTGPTREIAAAMLDDAAGIVADEARRYKVPPLYEKRDVEATMSLWETLDYHAELKLNDDFTVLLKDAGHILGSAMICLTDRNTFKKIVFTGDLGNTPTPLMRNTEDITDANYLIMESVYGDRNHEAKDDRRAKLKEVLMTIINRKGTLLIPVFSLEKTQVLLHEMNNFIESGEIPSVPVFFDSPLGIRLTDIYAKQFQNFNDKVQARILSGDDIFDFPKLIRTFSKLESEQIRKTNGPKIIIASSGMSSGGRILDHEKEYLPDPKNAILFIGFQSLGTVGRSIEEGLKEVRIDGETVPVKAQIFTVSGYSSHKGSDDLVEFVSKSANTLKMVFTVMGEPKSTMFLAQRLKDSLNVNAMHPEEGKVIEL